FEWFGGTVNASYLVVNDSKGDDLFDTDFGYSGTVTNFLGRKAGFGSDDKDPNGFEWDNSGAGEEYSPYTNPTFQKGTLCGKDLSAAPSNSYGAVLRRRTKGTITETVFNGFKFAFDVRNSKEASNPTAPVVTSSTVFGGDLDNGTSTTSDADETAWFNGGSGNVTTDPGFSADDCFAAPGSTEFNRVVNSNKGAFTGNATWLQGAWLDWSEN
ncbi:MAG TPA: hypothetical protein VK524_06455, partial [Polyangiaceae bacterium]|nr:hypothetical protein [Polyangiaceae bacterium]